MVALADWIRFPRTVGEWGYRADAWLNELSTLVSSLHVDSPAELSYATLWSTFSSVQGPITAHRTNDGRVHLSGMAKRTTGLSADNSVTVGTLPEGYRPSLYILASGVYNNGTRAETCRVNILTSGDIVLHTGAGSLVANQWFSVEGISFVTTDEYVAP